MLALAFVVALAAPAAMAAPATQEPTGTVRYVELAPTESIAVHESGAGEPIVIVPGLLGSAFGFRRVIPQLNDAGFRVVVIDMLGAGSSSAPENADYSLTAQAARILAVTERLGIPRAVYVCQAIGGSICYRAALQQPDRIAAIVSIHGGPAEGLATPGLKFALKLAPLIKLFGGTGKAISKVRDGLIDSSFDPSWVTDSVVAGYTAHYSNGIGPVLSTLKRMVNAQEPALLGPAMKDISVPVHVLIGAGAEKGAMSAQDVLGLRAIPGVELDSVTIAGQYIHEEQPDLVVWTVLETVREVQADALEAETSKANDPKAAADTLPPVARARPARQDSRAIWSVLTHRSGPPR